jgi:ubiquinone/menaquinone biosynthesis C-methylase UbiE
MKLRLQLHSLLGYFLRIFFDILYNQMAWAYDSVANIVSLGQWKDWVLSVSPELNGPRVLEIGHGPGHLLFALNTMGVDSVGIDASAKMGNKAYRRLKYFDFQPSLVRGVSARLPFRSDSFHQLVSTFPSDFILDPSTINEANRVLIPGGTMVILPVVWIDGRGLLERFFSFLFNITGQSPEWDDRYTLPFTQAGFSIDIEKRIAKSGILLLIHAQKPTKE